MADRPTSTKRPRKPADRERKTARTDTNGNPGRSPDQKPAQNQDLVSQVVWDIASINVHIDEIRHFWAKEIGISGPQWMILMAIGDLDRGNGVSVKDVSAMLHVDPSFVTTQSKMLEKNGFMRRVPSTEDARVVLMSLSDKASKKLAQLSARRDNLTAFVFSGYDEAALRDISDQLSALKSRLEKATLMLSIVG